MSIMRNIIYFFLLFSVHIINSQNIFDVSRNGTVDQLKEIYHKDSTSIYAKNENGHAPLTLACYNGNYDVVVFLVNKLDSIDFKSDYGSPLMAAVVKGETKIVSLLVESDADVNMTDKNGTTALHYAVMFRNYDIIKLLLDVNADFNLKDNRNQSALDYALIFNDQTIINLLNN